MAEYIIDVQDNIERVKWSEVDAKTRLMGLPLREEIIRCRDCKHFKEDGCRCRYFLSPYPSTVDGEIVKGAIMMSYVDPDGFCAWAERDA